MPRSSSSKIPIEIISEEESVSIEAAFAFAARSPATSGAMPATKSPFSASKLHRNAISINSVPVQAKRRLFMCPEHDIEDYGDLLSSRKRQLPRAADTLSSRKKKSRAAETLLHRFRSKRGLFVTDVTKTEWCDKQMEFSLFHKEWKNNEAKPDEKYLAPSARGWKKTKAMKAGIDRHAQLQEEIQEPVEVKLKSCEDDMALKLINFINGVTQLLVEGLTRELPIVSFAFEQGIWMVGQIDEIRMPNSKKYQNPILVETKTRSSDTVPLESQKRNGRIQLMCYKYLWDNLVSHADHDFPSKQLFNYFELNPKLSLCKDLQKACAKSGIKARTLGDVVKCYQNKCKMLRRANNKLVLRYEYQEDQSLLDEETFAYDDVLIENQIRDCLEFWLGQREASYVAEEDQWKCGYCDFSSECPANTATESTESFSSDDDSSEYEYY